MEDKPIYVAYVGLGNIQDQEEIEKVMKAAYNSIGSMFSEKDGEIIFIPIHGGNSRLECINPKYITDGELIRKHRLLIDELHEHLDSHLKELLENERKDQSNG